MNNDNNFNNQNQFGAQGNFNQQPAQPQPVNPQVPNQNMNQTTYNNPNVNQNYNPNASNQGMMNNYNQPVQPQPVNPQVPNQNMNQMAYNNPNVNQSYNPNVSNQSAMNNYNQPVQPQPINNNYNPNQTSYVPSSSKGGFDKKIFIIGGVILGIIALIVLLLIIKPFGGKSNKDNTKLYYDIEKPILVEDNEKYGYVSYDGKKIIDVKYDYATEFYGDYAVVGMKENDYDSYVSKYQVIDQKGNIKMDEIRSMPNYDAEYGLWELNNTIYDHNFKPVFKKDRMYDSIGDGYFSYIDVVKGESGILDYKGKTVFKWDKDYIYADVEVGTYDLEGKDVYAIIESDDDIENILSLKTGKIIFSADDDDQYIYYEDNNLFSLNDYDTDEERWIYVRDGKVIYQAEGIYDVEVYDPENGILELNYGYDVDRDERYKYYDAINKKMLGSEPSEEEMRNTVFKMVEDIYGYRVFEADGKYGLIKNDKVVLSGEYEDVELFEPDVYNFIKDETGKELFIFEFQDKIRIIDVKENKEVVAFSAYSVETDQSTFVIADITERYSTIRYDVYNLITGKMKSFDKDADIELFSNYVIVSTDESIEYYNANLEKVYSIQLEKDEPIIEEPESSFDDDEVEEETEDEEIDE